MKISNTYVHQVLAAYLQKVEGGKPERAGASQAEKVKPDSVALSKEAGEVQIARRALAKVPEVREDKIAELRKRIESGEYKVDARKLAEAILADSD